MFRKRVTESGATPSASSAVASFGVSEKSRSVRCCPVKERNQNALSFLIGPPSPPLKRFWVKPPPHAGRPAPPCSVGSRRFQEKEPLTKLLPARVVIATCPPANCPRDTS